MTCSFDWFENSKGACIKAFRDDFVYLKYFLINSCQQELSTKILLWFNQWWTSFQTYLHHNFTVWYDTCCFVQKDYFNLNYRNAWRSHLRSLKGKFCIISIGKIPCQLNIQIFIMLSVIFSLKPGSCCQLNFWPWKSVKLNRAPNFFIGSIAMKLS